MPLKTRPSYILDFGCGKEKWLIKNDNPKVVGVDVNSEALKSAKRALKQANLVCCDGHFLAFKEKTFNYVRVYYVIHHMQDYRRAVREINRVLNGILELTEAVCDNPFLSFSRKIIGRWQNIPLGLAFKASHLKLEVNKYFKIQKLELSDSLKILWVYDWFHLQYHIPSLIQKMNTSYQRCLRKSGLMKYFASVVKIDAKSRIIPIKQRT